MANHFLTLPPECFGVVRIDRVSTDSFAGDGNGRSVRYDVADVAVLALAAADVVSGSDQPRPYRCCRALRNGLPLERRFTCGRELLIDLGDEVLDAAGVDMAGQIGLNASGMDSGSAYATPSMAPIESNREEDVGGLRATIGGEGLIRRPLKVGILEVDIGIPVPCGGEVDQPPSGADERRDTINEYKVAEVVGAELRLKAICGVTERLWP